GPPHGGLGPRVFWCAVSILFRDYETRSAAQIRRSGAHRNAADRTTEVVCVGYAIDDGPVEIWTLGQPIPQPFINAASSEDWLIVAHNDAFERAIEELILCPRYAWPLVPLARHRCTMALALAAALPAKLETVAAALRLPFQKDLEGERLMQKMSRPRKPRDGEDPSAGPYWHDEPELLARWFEYCKCDVEIERALYYRLPPLSDSEQRQWVL